MTDRTIELDQQRGPVAQMQTEIRRLLAEVEADERTLSHRKKELETRLAAAAKLTSYDAPEKVRYLDDLRRFSCEMPDAPHLMEVFSSAEGPACTKVRSFE